MEQLTVSRSGMITINFFKVGVPALTDEQMHDIVKVANTNRSR